MKRLDIYLGEPLRQQLDEDAALLGITSAELLRRCYQEQRLSWPVLRDQVQAAVLACAAAITPDGRFDPADDNRLDQPLSELARQLGSAYAALGVVEALRTLMEDRI